jgi:hypothetical protein
LVLADAATYALVERFGIGSELDRLLARLAAQRALLVLDDDDLCVVPREGGTDGFVVACV